MPAVPWTTQDQFDFLVQEDAKWLAIKEGSTTLKSFYIQTSNTFHQRWPVTPNPKELLAAEDDEVRAQKIAEENLLGVCTITFSGSTPHPYCSASHDGTVTVTVT